MGIESIKSIEIFRLLHSAFGSYKPQILLMALLGFVSGILEGIGINAIIPLFAFISGGPIEATDAISKIIERFFIYFNLSYTVKSLLAFIVVLFIIKAIALFFSRYLTAGIIADYEKKTRGEVLKLTLASNWLYLFKQKVGYLDQILTTNIKASSDLLAYLSGAILVIANLIVYSLLIINISPVIAASALVIGILVLLFFWPLFQKTQITSGEEVKSYKQLAHLVNESIIGMKTIKSAAIEDRVLERGRAYFEYMKNLHIQAASLKNFTNVTLPPIGLFFIVGIFAYFYKAAVFNFASFAVIVYALDKVFNNLQLVQTQAHAINAQIPHLMSVLNYVMEAAMNQEKESGQNRFGSFHSLELENVSFSYDATGRILSDINFSIRKGELIGLIGPSGAGKTTFVDLLLRLFEPQEGVILLNGGDASEIGLRDWRKNVGYVSQDVFLLNDTIGNNIRFYDDSISEEDLVAAAKMANIYNFIQEQPQKFLTPVGERGLALSGGQRQRVALARMLARKPKILILDEATSALDNESELFIQKSIESLRGEVAVIIIAHRLSTVMIADKLVILDEGRITEEGVPSKLLQDRGSYFAKLYNLKS